MCGPGWYPVFGGVYLTRTVLCSTDTEGGLAAPNSSFSAFSKEDDGVAAPVLEGLTPLLDADERQAAYLEVLGEKPDAEEAAGVEGGEDVAGALPFCPSPPKLLFPRARVCSPTEHLTLIPNPPVAS